MAGPAVLPMNLCGELPWTGPWQQTITRNFAAMTGSLPQEIDIVGRALPRCEGDFARESKHVSEGVTTAYPSGEVRRERRVDVCRRRRRSVCKDALRSHRFADGSTRLRE